MSKQRLHAGLVATNSPLEAEAERIAGQLMTIPRAARAACGHQEIGSGSIVFDAGEERLQKPGRPT